MYVVDIPPAVRTQPNRANPAFTKCFWTGTFWRLPTRQQRRVSGATPRFVALGIGALALAAALASVPSASGAGPYPPKPELRGIIEAGGERRYMLSLPGGKHSEWLSISDSFAGWRLSSFDPKTGALTLDGQSPPKAVIYMETARVVDRESLRPTSAQLATLFSRMKNAEHWAAFLEHQKQRDPAERRASMEALGLPRDTSDEDFKAYFNQRIQITAEGENVKDHMADVARAYSDVYTSEEIEALSAFADSEAGRAEASKDAIVLQKWSDYLHLQFTKTAPLVAAAERAYVDAESAKRPPASAESDQTQQAPAGPAEH